MANKNFEIKNGLTVAGTERITAAGAGSLTNLTLSGNLTVNGTTVTLDASTLQVADKNIVLNYHASNDTSSASGGAGITIQDAVNGTTDATILWDASDDEFDFSHGINIPNLKVSGGQGTDGQLLTSTGSGVAWEDAPASGPTFKAFGTSSIMVGDSTTGTINAADYNTGLGIDIFKYLTTGDKNTVLGFEAGMSLLTHNENTLIGYQAGKLLGNGAESWEAQRNTFIGAGAGRDVDEGSKNIAIGYEAMMSSTSTSTHDIAIGYQAMQYRASSIGDSIAIGVSAHRGVNGGNLNANRNVAVGSYTLEIVETYGQQNTAVGWYTGKGVTSGNSNTLIGSEAGEAVSTGQKNTLIGYQAGELITSGGFNVVLGGYDGNEGGLDIRTASNRVVISDGAGNIRMYIDNTGNVGIGETNPDQKFHVNSGTANVVAKFESTDSISGIMLADNGGNVELSTSGATFRVQPSGGATAMQVRSDGGVAIGSNNAGYSSQILSVKSAAADNVFYGESTDANCIMSVRDNSSTANIGFGATANAHVFSQDGTEIARFSTGSADKYSYNGGGLGGTGTNLHLSSDDCEIKMANNFIHSDNSGNTKFTIRTGYGATSSAAELSLDGGYISFNTGTSFTERMRIDSSGRVGIRNDGPGDYHAQADDLVIGDSSGHSGMTFRSSTTDAGNIFFADGTSGSQAYMGSIQYFHGADTSNNLSERMSFGCNGGSEVLRLSRTTNIGYTSDGLFNSLARPSRWQATGAGALLLGYRDSGSGLYSAALALEYDAVNGLGNTQYVDGILMRDTASGTLHLRIETNGNVKNTNNSYGSMSDSRLKTDIADAASQWDDVKALRVRKYKFGTAPAGHDFLQIGVIAQELEASGMSGLVSESEPDDAQIKYAPELVGNQVKTVKYSVLYMKAIKALQEAMTRIETLESKVATLEGE